jgi:hypothetical protein
MQRLLSGAVWDVDGVRDEVRAFALEYLGTAQAIVAIDETSFPKREEHSAGVKKQYCGTTGQVQHCQVLPPIVALFHIIVIVKENSNASRGSKSHALQSQRLDGDSVAGSKFASRG